MKHVSHSPIAWIGSPVLLSGMLFAACADQHSEREDDNPLHGLDASPSSVEVHDAGPSNVEADDAGPLLTPAVTAADGDVARADAKPICEVRGDRDTLGIESLATGYGKVFEGAKQACDAELAHTTCGDFRLTFDSAGCLVRFEIQSAGDPVAAATLPPCIVGQMNHRCEPCAANASRREYVSCTLL